jgi:hypothetical protein
MYPVIDEVNSCVLSERSRESIPTILIVIFVRGFFQKYDTVVSETNTADGMFGFGR